MLFVLKLMLVRQQSGGNLFGKHSRRTSRIEVVLPIVCEKIPKQVSPASVNLLMFMFPLHILGLVVNFHGSVLGQILFTFPQETLYGSMGYILIVMLMAIFNHETRGDTAVMPKACLKDIKSLTSNFLLLNPYLYSSGGFMFNRINVYLARQKM